MKGEDARSGNHLPTDKSQYYHGSTGVFPWEYWSFPVEVLATRHAILSVSLAEVHNLGVFRL